MSVTAALVLFSVTWSMIFFIVLPLRLVTQGDAGQVVPGTHSSSPHEFHLGWKLRITTYWSVAIFALLTVVILWGPIGVRDLDWFNRMAPPLSQDAQ